MQTSKLRLSIADSVRCPKCNSQRFKVLSDEVKVLDDAQKGNAVIKRFQIRCWCRKCRKPFLVEFQVSEE
jgi:Zn finger protein HypA/HybF involved in hydrogenase expression